MRRRALLSTLSAVPPLALSGCLAGLPDDGEIHEPVREWQTDRSFTVTPDDGEVINVEVDTRRSTPATTRLSIRDPDDEVVATDRLEGTTLASSHEVDRAGPHEVFVTPQDSEGRGRVWIRLTVDDDPLTLDAEQYAPTLAEAIETSPRAELRDWEVDGDGIRLVAETDDSSFNLVVLLTDHYAESVENGLDTPLRLIVDETEHDERHRYRFTVEAAEAFLADGDRESFIETVLETREVEDRYTE